MSSRHDRSASEDERLYHRTLYPSEVATTRRKLLNEITAGAASTMAPVAAAMKLESDGFWILYWLRRASSGGRKLSASRAQFIWYPVYREQYCSEDGEVYHDLSVNNKLNRDAPQTAQTETIPEKKRKRQPELAADRAERRLHEELLEERALWVTRVLHLDTRSAQRIPCEALSINVVYFEGSIFANRHQLYNARLQAAYNAPDKFGRELQLKFDKSSPSMSPPSPPLPFRSEEHSVVYTGRAFVNRPNSYQLWWYSAPKKRWYVDRRVPKHEQCRFYVLAAHLCGFFREELADFGLFGCFLEDRVKPSVAKGLLCQLRDRARAEGSGDTPGITSEDEGQELEKQDDGPAGKA